MLVLLNGQARELADGETVAGVLRSLAVAGDAGGVAVAVDGEVVRRAEWDTTLLRDGSQLEIVAAVQGG